MVDLVRDLDGVATRSDGRCSGWGAPAEGLRACLEQSMTRLRRVEDAHERQRRSSAVTDETVRAAGLSREDILEEPTWQTDLPFFMQRTFR